MQIPVDVCSVEVHGVHIHADGVHVSLESESGQGGLCGTDYGVQVFGECVGIDVLCDVGESGVASRNGL